MSATTAAKRKKSEPLSDAELTALKAYRLKFNTEVDCAITLSIDRLVLNRVLMAGSGSPETIKKIKKVLRKDMGTA